MKRVFSAAAVLLMTGCVSSGTYDALVAEHETTVKKLADRERENQELKDALAKEQQESADLDVQIKKLQGDMAAMLKEKGALQSSIDEMNKALQELQRRKAEADARIAEYKGLLAKFKSLIDAGKLKVKIRDGRMVVELATDVLFASGSAVLSKDGKTAIAEVAGLLATIPARKFQVEGHTDNVPIMTAQYPSNWELAAGRALTVLKTMVDAGMPGDRISAASFGDSMPSRANDSPEGKAANRRIEIVVVPDLSSLPGFEELNKVGS